MLLFCIFFAVSLPVATCIQRNVDAENDEVQFEDKLPETIWIGSRFGLIPYDIDWIYYNKTKEHFMKDMENHPRLQSKGSRTTGGSNDDNNSKSSAKESARQNDYGERANDNYELSTSTAASYMKQANGSATVAQTRRTAEAVNEVLSASVSGGEAAKIEAEVTAVASIPSFSKYLPNTSYYEENSALAEEAETSESPLVGGTVTLSHGIAEKMENIFTSGYDAIPKQAMSSETHKPGSNSRNESSAELTSSSEESQSSRRYPPSVSSDSIRKTTTITTAHSTAPGQESSGKKKENTPPHVEHTDIAETGKHSFPKHATFKGKKAYKTDKHKAQKTGNCGRVTDILALSNYLQVKIIESLLYESISWPRGERSHFRSMVNHMRRELQAMNTDKEQLKVIRSHLLRYMGSDKERQNLVLPLTIGEWEMVKCGGDSTNAKQENLHTALRKADLKDLNNLYFLSRRLLYLNVAQQ